MIRCSSKAQRKKNPLHYKGQMYISTNYALLNSRTSGKNVIRSSVQSNKRRSTNTWIVRTRKRWFFYFLGDLKLVNSKFLLFFIWRRAAGKQNKSMRGTEEIKLSTPSSDRRVCLRHQTILPSSNIFC